MYEKVDCKQWQGYHDPAAWGSDWSQQDSACCPMRPYVQPITSLTDTTVTLPPAIVKEAQKQSCPSYDDVHQRSADPLSSILTVPNTSNILSRRKGQDRSNSAISAHASLTALQVFRNALYHGRPQQNLLQQMAQRALFFPVIQHIDSWQNGSFS